MQRKDTAVPSTSTKDSYMGGCWTIVDLGKKFKKFNELYYKEYNENTPEVA